MAEKMLHRDPGFRKTIDSERVGSVSEGVGPRQLVDIFSEGVGPRQLVDIYA
jgi:hypothetical protein